MGLTYDRRDSGLVVAEFGQDEAAIQRALREYDDALRLVPRCSEHFGQLYYSVYRYAGSDRPAEFLCAWLDEENRPRPLSSGLLELVKQLDRNTRSAALDADVANARRLEQQARQDERDRQDLVEDWLPREGRAALLPRGQSLRMARDKRRARGEKV